MMKLKIKSIQTKFTILIVIAVTISTMAIGGIAIYRFNKHIDKTSAETMNLLCIEHAQELNYTMGRIEQSVEVMAKYVTDNFEGVDRFTGDATYVKNYVSDIEALGQTIARNTDGVVSYYVRFNPEFANDKAGFFKVYNSGLGEFEEYELTSITQYEKDDISHLGWYYIPIEAKEAVWIQPYYNENIDVYMISYVIPIYKDDILIGVVGMDIDFEYVIQQIDEISLYDTGHAFIADANLNVVHSRHIEKGTSIRNLSEKLSTEEIEDMMRIDTYYEHEGNGKRAMMAIQHLRNDMYLIVTAPVSEINADKNELMVDILVLASIISIVFILITGIITNKMVQPLKDLKRAAQEIADGNLLVSLECKSNDEVGALTQSFKETAKQLKLRIDYINNLAYMDKLTGVKNNTAYLQELSWMREKIENEEVAFSVFVIDVNGLKYINDYYGHDYGNTLLVGASEAMVTVFGSDNVYRVGGDEFVIILKDVSEEQCEEYREQFMRRLEKNNSEIIIEAAVGVAEFDKNIDDSYETVFKRADENMYRMKQDMKKMGLNSRWIEK